MELVSLSKTLTTAVSGACVTADGTADMQINSALIGKLTLIAVEFK
jgi:hypothetical protein